MEPNYFPVRSTESHDEDADEEAKVPLRYGSRFPVDFERKASRAGHRFWFNLWSLLNIVLSVVLLIAAVSLMNRAKILNNIPTPPYSVVREDGAERYINTQYRPNNLFQSPPSDIVDEAWNGWLRDHDHLVKIPQKKAKQFGLPETVELYNDRGYGAYSLGVFHQMHCLNRIRKSFYPKRYYANETAQEVLHHINHCLDVLRQAILCHGDISMVYWWNSDYTVIDDAGNRQYSEDYLSKTLEERAKGSFVKWDVEVQCRDMDAVNAWAKTYEVDDDKYGGQLVD